VAPRKMRDLEDRYIDNQQHARYFVIILLDIWLLFSSQKIAGRIAYFLEVFRLEAPTWTLTSAAF
jgi:hypothetical protein